MGDEAQLAVAHLDALFDRAPVGLGVWDRDLRYLRVNDALAEINGVTEHECVGRTIAEVLPGLWPAVGPVFRAVLDEGAVLSGDVVRGSTPREPGVVREWTCSYFPVRADDGEVLAAAAVVVETTDRWRAEEERDASLERLAETVSELEAMQRISDAALGSLELDDLLGELLARVREAVRADLGRVVLADERRRRLRVHATHGADADELVDDREAELLQTVITSGEPLLLAEPTIRPRLGGTPVASAALVPLAVGAQVVGVLQVGWVADGMPANALDLLRVAAGRAATAIEHARVYARERRIAATLQRTLMPPRLPEVTGLELAARFRPAGEGLELGGDFYDVFPLADDAWALAVGDVRGKGAGAAAVTALARYTIRTAALHVGSPEAVLRALNTAVFREYDGEGFLTVVVAFVRPGDDGGTAVRLASAGHPEPLLRRADGEVVGLGLGATVLGWEPELRAAGRDVLLRPGDALLLYTDGLLDAAAPRQVVTERDLKDLLARQAGPELETLAADLLRAAVGAAVLPRDDIALLLARCTPR